MCFQALNPISFWHPSCNYVFHNNGVQKMKTLILIITLISMTSAYSFHEDAADCGAGSQEAQKQAIVVGAPGSGASGSGI